MGFWDGWMDGWLWRTLGWAEVLLLALVIWTKQSPRNRYYHSPAHHIALGKCKRDAHPHLGCHPIHHHHPVLRTSQPDHHRSIDRTVGKIGKICVWPDSPKFQQNEKGDRSFVENCPPKSQRILMMREPTPSR